MSFRFDLKTGRMRILPPQAAAPVVVETPKVEDHVVIDVPVVEPEAPSVDKPAVVEPEVPAVDEESEEEFLDIEDAPTVYAQEYDY
jgi:hypothetical protein